MLTIVHIGLPEQGKKIHPDIGKALSIMEHFFAYFDDSADGFIEKDELLKAFGVDRKGSEVRFNSSAAESLFAKLDFDHSGKVSFKEFLVGIEVRRLCARPVKARGKDPAAGAGRRRVDLLSRLRRHYGAPPRRVAVTHSSQLHPPTDLN